MTSRCKLWPEYGNGSTAWYMDGWGEFQKELYQGEGKKGRHPPVFLRHMGFGLHAETGFRKVYAGEAFEWQKKSRKIGPARGNCILYLCMLMYSGDLDANETIGDGGGWKYANSQFSDENRQDAISRVSAVQNSVGGPRWEHWRSGGWNTLSHQQCRLQRDGNDIYGCPPIYRRHLYWRCLVVNLIRFSESVWICQFVRTDLTGKLSKHIHAPDLGPKLPS